jgi:lipoprotein-anchoring transpeptidase ErfK/SrfK
VTKDVGVTRLAVEGRATPAVRAALIAGVALTLLAGLMSAADAAPGRQRYFFLSPSSGFVTPVRPVRAARSAKRLKTPRGETAKKTSPEKQGFPDIAKGVQQIVVSTGSQRVTLFSNGVRVAQGPVSTGTASNPTPLGVFSVIEKDRYHRSNLYGNAPMFYMQRLTWSGVAMHEGPLPGYPASHGCIRLTTDFAARLWPTTRLGVRVIVARSELAPVEFSHPALFIPKLKPAEPKVAMNVTTDGHVTAPLQMAEATPPSTEAVTIRDVTAAAPETPVADDEVPQPGQPAPEPATAVPATAAVDGDAVKPGPTLDPPKPMAPKTKAADQPQKRKGQVAVFVSRKEKKLFVRHGFIPIFDMPIVIENPDRPLGTHVFTAMEVTDNGAGMRWNLFTVPSNPRQPEPANKDKKVKGKELPKSRPVADTRPPSTAAESLARIQMPAEAIDRIGELLTPGSSLVISDEGLGRETGRYTEFIVLTR